MFADRALHRFGFLIASGAVGVAFGGAIIFYLGGMATWSVAAGVFDGFGISVSLALSGLKVIPVGHRGMLKFFGRRCPKWVVGEGWVWGLWGIATYIVWDARRRSQTFGVATVFTRDGVRLSDLIATVVYRVTDPVAYTDTVPEDIEKNLTAATQGVVRNAVQQRDASVLLSPVGPSENEPGRVTKEAIAAIQHELEADILQALGQRAGAWGITVQSVFIGDVQAPTELTEALARTLIGDFLRGDERKQEAAKLDIAKMLVERAGIQPTSESIELMRRRLEDERIRVKAVETSGGSLSLLLQEFADTLRRQRDATGHS